jgi:hypothetical protein
VTTFVPVFYDCEASGLEGHPIEIGWAFAEPRTGAVVSEICLIKRSAEWLIEESWDSKTGVGALVEPQIAPAFRILEFAIEPTVFG